MQEYKCFECGISSQFGNSHRMGCGSKKLMESYVDVLNGLRKFPVDMLNKLEFNVHVEQLERKLAFSDLNELSGSLGLHNME